MSSRMGGLAREHAGLAASLLALAIGAKAVVGRIGGFDLGFHDECYVLDIGTGLFDRPLPPPEYMPLYAVWYRLLAAIEPDPVPLYTFNWVVLQLALIGLLWVLARRSGASRFAAGVVTASWSLTRAVTVWPFAVYFSTAILAIGAIAATFTKDRLVATTTLVVATAAASFVRPELAVPGLGLAGIAAAWSVARALRSRRARPLGAALAIAVTIAALVHVFGSPLGGVRSWFAFQQHYAWHRVEAGHLDVDPMSQYEPIVSADFPHARSIVAAALENPSAFAWHLQWNVRLLLRRLGWFLEVDEYVPTTLKLVVALAAAAVLAVGAFALVARVRRLPAPLTAWMPLWIPLGASFAAAVILIHPRDHYLVPFSFFAVATLAAATGAMSGKSPWWARAQPFAGFAGLATAIAMLLALPTYRRGALPSLLAATGTPPPTEWEARNTVAALRALNLQGERVVFDAEFSRAVYARLRFRPIYIDQKDRPFGAFVRDNDIDVVILTDRLREDARFRDDPEFQSFLAEGGDHLGFVLSPVPRAATIIAHRPK